MPKAPPISIVLDDVRKSDEGLLAALERKGAVDDVQAVYYRGSIYVYPYRFQSLDQLMFVVGRHEIRHYGFDAMLGKQRRQVLLGIGMKNADLMAEAKVKLAQGKADDIIEGIEEAMADMPAERIAALTGIDRLVSRVRQWLRELAATLREKGHTMLADAIEPKAWTDKDIAAFVGRAEDVSRKGTRAMATGAAMTSREDGISRHANTFAEARTAARAFVGKDLTNRATGLISRVSRNSLDKMLNAKAVGKSESPAKHSAAVANLDALYERALHGWSKPDAKGDPNIAAVHRFFAKMSVDGQTLLAKITVLETADKTPNRVYSVESVEFNEKSPAAQWVAASATADGVGLTSTRSARDVLSLAQEVEQKLAEGKASNLIGGIEEALADMPVDRIESLTGIDRLIAAVRQWLRELAASLREKGHETLAAAIEPEAWTDRDIAAFVRKAEDVSRVGGASKALGQVATSRAGVTDTPNAAGPGKVDAPDRRDDTARYAADPDRNHLRVVDFAREQFAERHPGFLLRAVEAPGSGFDLRAARAFARRIAGHDAVFVRQDGERLFNGVAF